jgi:Uncharacterised protein family (UPF0236)
VLRRGRRGRSVRPFLERGGITPRGCSEPLQRRIADFGAERSGRSAVSGLKEHYGIDVPFYSVELITRRIAKETASFNVRRSEPKQKSDVQVTELDGSMVPIVEFRSADAVNDPKAKRDKRKRRSCKWSEIRVCTTHDTKRADARYGACFGGALEAGLMMEQNCQQAGMNERTRIHGIGDGAPWIAEQYERRFGLQGTFLIDFYHLCEYVAAAASQCVGGDRKEAWVEVQKERLLKNQYQTVIDELADFVEPETVVEEQAPVRKCWRYLTNRTAHLDYRGAREKELPIGSGEVESAHRHVIQKRLKLPGAWWSPEHASSMAQMRVNRANDEWSTFWAQKAA